MTSLNLYLLRHGESALNQQRVFAGKNSDPALTSTGMKQASHQALKYKDTPFSTIYSSPYMRARQTAEIMKGNRNLDIKISKDLIEVDIGSLDGQSIDRPENLTTYYGVISQWEQGIHQARFPAGESLTNVGKRFRTFLSSIPEKETSGPILVVGHGILFMTVLWLFCQEQSNHIQDYYMGRCHLTIATWNGKQLQPHQLNLPPIPGEKSISALA